MFAYVDLLDAVSEIRLPFAPPFLPPAAVIIGARLDILTPGSSTFGAIVLTLELTAGPRAPATLSIFFGAPGLTNEDPARAIAAAMVELGPNFTYGEFVPWANFSIADAATTLDTLTQGSWRVTVYYLSP
jgi:hypothetical protein